MLIWLVAVALAEDSPLELTITDPRVRTVILNCGAEEMSVEVRNGVAAFPRAYSGCNVTMLRTGGTISSPGKWTCTLDRCEQNDVHHLPISNAPGRVILL